MAKLDIEGAEPFAIRGAASLLKAGNPPVLQIEAAGYSKNFGVPTDRLLTELCDLGYEITVFDPISRQLTPIRSPWEAGVDNVLAVYAARRNLVEERIAPQ